MTITIAQQSPAAASGEAVPCPSWCTAGAHDPLDVAHGSDCRDVDGAVAPGHFCGWARDGEAGPCTDEIAAMLLRVAGSPTVLYVTHGDDQLPALTIDGAERVANVILALVAEARGESGS